MPRPVWNGVISFGLINVPVQLYTAARSVDLHFRMLDARNRKPIRYERVNSATGEEVPWKEIVKAYEYRKGSYVVVGEKELRKLAPEATGSVDVETFVERSAVDPMYFEKPYYLGAVKRAEKGYVLLRETLRRTGKVAIARVVIRTRQYLAMLLPHDNALVLNLLRFQQELVDAKEFSFPGGALNKYRITPAELRMAEQLITSMAGEWKPHNYKDEFRAQLHKLLQTRINKKEGTLEIEPGGNEPPEHDSTNVVDFVALLKKSLATKAAAHTPRKAARKPRRRAARKRA